MSNALVRINRTSTNMPAIQTEAADVIVPGYDSVLQVTPVAGGMRVYSNGNFLVDNMLYSIDGTLRFHNASGRWYFDGLQAIMPKVSGAKKDRLLDAVTGAVNDYLKEHPELSEVMTVVAWENKRRLLVNSLEAYEESLPRLEKNVEQERTVMEDRIKYAEKRVTDTRETIRMEKAKLAEHEKQRPALWDALVEVTETTPQE